MGLFWATVHTVLVSDVYGEPPERVSVAILLILKY